MFYIWLAINVIATFTVGLGSNVMGKYPKETNEHMNYGTLAFCSYIVSYISIGMIIYTR